jgi:hypothetical protein
VGKIPELGRRRPDRDPSVMEPLNGSLRLAVSGSTTTLR